MARTDTLLRPIQSARPEFTAKVMAETGLDEGHLSALVHRFYEKARADEMLGPVFEAHVGDWDAHFPKMEAFWSSVALMTGRYHGAPVPAHARLPVTWEHFERWLTLFRETAAETCPPKGAELVVERAERIARSLHMAIADAGRLAGDVPRL